MRQQNLLAFNTERIARYAQVRLDSIRAHIDSARCYLQSARRSIGVPTVDGDTCKRCGAHLIAKENNGVIEMLVHGLVSVFALLELTRGSRRCRTCLPTTAVDHNHPCDQHLSNTRESALFFIVPLATFSHSFPIVAFTFLRNPTYLLPWLLP